MSFSIIAAIGKNYELGKAGGLVFNIKDDMKYFKNTTTGHPVIMGFNTWKSIGKKLPNRKNIVVSYESVPEADITVSDLPKFIAENQDSPEEIFVIGGGMLYKQMLEHANTLYLTEIDASADADTFFPDFDKSKYHKEIIKKGTENGINFAFVKYTLI